MKTLSHPWLLSDKYDYSDWNPPAAIADSAFAYRRIFFERHPLHRNGLVVCPACGYPTLRARRDHDYCSLCNWEDDGQDDPWADLPNGGPNDSSLTQARLNFEDTNSVWAWTEAPEFCEEFQQRLFSKSAQKQQLLLRSLYDRLLTLKSTVKIEYQWKKIISAWDSDLKRRSG